MKKSVLVISLVFLLTSCQAVTTPAPINTTIPAVTTSTIEPTPTSVPPTLAPTATLVNIDFEMPTTFASFENQFPLNTITQTNGYILRCTFDSAQIEYGSVMLPDGLEMRTWAKCFFKKADGKLDYVNVPLYINNSATATELIAIGVGVNDEVGTNTGYRGNGLKVMMENVLKITTGTEKNKVLILGLGFGSESTVTDRELGFMQPLIDDTPTGALNAFAASGDTSKLKKYGQVDHFLAGFDYLVDMFNK